MNYHQDIFSFDVIPTNSFTHIVRGYINENDLKFPQLGKPLRYVLTGRTNAPGIGELIYLLGNEESRKRIKNYLE